MQYRLLLLLAISSAVQAADVDVRVTSSAHDTPMANAAVCLGTPGNPDQFGAYRTDTEGHTSFRVVPETPLLLTVSKVQYKGEQRLLSGSQNNRTVTVVLRRGGGGPSCTPPVGESLADMGTRLQVAHCKLNRGAASTASRTVTLDCPVKGAPTHYRASERRDFGNADWQPYKPTVRFKLSAGPGDKTVYYQARRSSESSGASLHMVSDVARDSIRLTGP